MNGSDLTILCVTAGREHAASFILDMERIVIEIDCNFLLLEDGDDVHSGGYVESVLDEAIDRCQTKYVLRLDDDESLPDETAAWLKEGGYRTADHWAFKRRNLWPDAEHHVSNPPLWPDLQTRLSVKAKSGGRAGIHSGSPFGTGTIAPVPIDHHKFLVRDQEEREALVQRYDNVAPGAGSRYVMFSLPERYEGVLKCRPI